MRQIHVQSLIASTYHSRIDKIQIDNEIAVRKTANRQNERTRDQWNKEVKALRTIAEDDDAPIANTAMLIDSEQETLSLIMRYEDGKSLDLHISSDMKCNLELANVQVLWNQMANAIAFLHDHGIIHDDVKPENIIWVAEEERSVLVDFGAVIFTEPGSKAQFHPSGTPPYAPPEFLVKRKGPEGDIWGLGITMLFARQVIVLPDGEWILPHVFEQEQPYLQMKAWLKEVEDRRIEIGDDYQLMGSMLEPDPDRRISAKELKEKLSMTGFLG